MNFCWVKKKVLLLMKEEGWKKFPNETGGILLGYRKDRSAVVTQLVGPGPLAKHEQFGFTPDYGFHMSEVDRIFVESEGTEIYLGDWHTHPKGSTELSDLDIKCLDTVAKYKEAYNPNPLMLVLGGNLDRLGVYGYSKERKVTGLPYVLFS
jgi:integrative and conjugative element protein (TIGR02256 family)